MGRRTTGPFLLAGAVAILLAAWAIFGWPVFRCNLCNRFGSHSSCYVCGGGGRATLRANWALQHERFPPEALLHGAAVLSALFLGFLITFVALRARENRSPGLPFWTGPVSLGWILTSAGALILVSLTLLGLRLHAPALWKVTWDDSMQEEAHHAWGMWVLRTSVSLTPLLVLLGWVRLLREARRRESPAGRHSPTALAGLLVSAGGLVAFWILLGPRLWK